MDANKIRRKRSCYQMKGQRLLIVYNTIYSLSPELVMQLV
jgi:hypothetical protein